MATEKQLKDFEKSLKIYMKEKLQTKYLDLNEASTRIIVNSFLCDVLGFAELEDIKTEYRIKNDYADYVIQLNKKLRMVVEVKAMNIDIAYNHLKQAFHYATDEGIDWLLLTNARELAVYKVIFGKPPRYELLFKYNLFENKKLTKTMLSNLYSLHKNSFKKNEIENLWKSHQVLAPDGLHKYLFDVDLLSLLKRKIKRDVNINFSEDEIAESLLKLINCEEKITQPKIKLPAKKIK